MIERIALITDFGVGSPYVGQVKLRLAALAPRVGVVDLVSDLPSFCPDLAAYLVPALARDVPAGTLFLCVVDPGVGGPRAPIALQADGCWYVGPDNGLLSVVARRARELRIRYLNWRPERMSGSFHGRDLFAPVAAMLAAGELPESSPLQMGDIVGFDWPDELERVIYVDAYGNLMTGIRSSAVDLEVRLPVAGREIVYARTFCEVSPGRPFWYENSLGLVELAVNQGSASRLLGLGPGDPVGARQNDLGRATPKRVD
jgi:S-adenosylmethionine hydrolase